jgi:hypothetical protein
MPPPDELTLAERACWSRLAAAIRLTLEAEERREHLLGKDLEKRGEALAESLGAFFSQDVPEGEFIEPDADLQREMDEVGKLTRRATSMGRGALLGLARQPSLRVRPVQAWPRCRSRAPRAQQRRRCGTSRRGPPSRSGDDDSGPIGRHGRGSLRRAPGKRNLRTAPSENR